MLCFVSRIFAAVNIFWSKFSKIMSKLDHFQIPISRQQIKAKTTLTPESTEIGLYIYNIILCHPIKFWY